MTQRQPWDVQVNTFTGQLNPADLVQTQKKDGQPKLSIPSFGVVQLALEFMS